MGKEKKLVRISDEELKRFDDMISQNNPIDKKEYSSVYELLNDRTKFLSPEEAEKKFKWSRLPEFKIENHSYQCMHTGQVFPFNSYFKGQIFKWMHNDNFTAFAVNAEKKDDSPYYWHGWKGNPLLAYFHNAEDAIKWNKLKFNW